MTYNQHIAFLFPCIFLASVLFHIQKCCRLCVLFCSQSPHKQTDGPAEYGWQTTKEKVSWDETLQSHDRYIQYFELQYFAVLFLCYSFFASKTYRLKCSNNLPFLLNLGAIQQSQAGSTEAAIINCMGGYLRSAPDRKGGLGRKSGQTAMDLASDSDAEQVNCLLELRHCL